MKISEAIKQMQKIKNKHGDLELYERTAFGTLNYIDKIQVGIDSENKEALVIET